MSRTIIEHGYVVPISTPEVIEDGIVAFEDSKLSYVGPRRGFDATQFGADQTIDAGGKVVLPGLVNTHTHLVGAYIKALTEDVPGKNKGDAAGLYKRAFPVIGALKPEDHYWGCMTHAMEMVMTGTTTISNTWMDETRAGLVAKDLGVRAVLSEMVLGIELTRLSATTLERPFSEEYAARHLDAAEKLHGTWHGKENGRITTRISPGGPGYCSADTLEKCRDLAKKLAIGVNIHIAEVPGETEFVTQRYGMRPIELGKKTGILGPDSIGFHMVFLTDSDIEILAETGTHFSHTSFHTPKRGYFPPMEKVYAKGVQVSFGSDWTSNDLWKFMRAGIMLPRARTGDVSMLSGYDALRMATLGGAKALGMDQEIGTLEVGKKADVILVDVTKPWYQPIYLPNLVSNLVWNSNGGDVTDVFVDGRRIVEDGEVTTVDRREIQKETQRRADVIWAQASKTW